MKRRKMGIIIVGSILFILFILIYFNSTKQLYGNNPESIVKVIASIEGFHDQSIEILEIKDIDEYRVVSFLSNNDPGYIQFTRNKDGNYKWNDLQVQKNENFSSFIPNISEILQFLFVTNNGNEIAKMQVTVNGIELEQKFVPGEATVTWLELPKTDSGSYTFRNYRYYDKNGYVIEEIE